MKNWKVLLFVLALAGVAAVGSLQAKVTLLPDYIKTNPFKDRINTRSAKKYEVLCANYGAFAKSYVQENGLACNKVFMPSPGLTCYKDCGCDPKFKYNATSCKVADGKELGGSTCNSLYDQCNCNRGVYIYVQNDSRCTGKTLTDSCTGTNGTFYKNCVDPCDGLTAANCVVGGVDMGCAQNYGNGCSLCKTCNANTCDLPANKSKPVIASECNGCSAPVPGCSTKCEPSGCGSCSSNCAGYRYETSGAVLNAATTDKCTLCGGTSRYKALTCVAGYKLDATTGGCVQMDCDEYLTSQGYALVNSAAAFTTAAAASKPIVLTANVTLGSATTLTKGVYTYSGLLEKGISNCANTKANLTVNANMTINGTGPIEIYPNINMAAAALLTTNTSVTAFGGATLGRVDVASGDLLLTGAADYKEVSGFSGAGKIVVGEGSHLLTEKINGPKLSLKTGGCATYSSTYKVCGKSDSLIEMLNTSTPQMYAPTTCSLSGVTKGNIKCTGDVYVSCSVGSVPMDLRVESPLVCPLSSLVADPALASKETYYPITVMTPLRIYCARCEDIDGCDDVATQCYRDAENEFRNCYVNNKNAQYCMNQVLVQKNACEVSRNNCKGPQSCAIQYAQGKTDTVVVKNSAELKSAVMSTNAKTIIVDSDIMLTEPLAIPSGKIVVGSTDVKTSACPCNHDNGNCNYGKYKITTANDGRPDAPATRNMAIVSGATIRDLEIAGASDYPTDFAVALQPGAASSAVTIDNSRISNVPGYAVFDASTTGVKVAIEGVSEIVGADGVAIKGRTFTTKGSGTKLHLNASAELTIRGVTGIDNLETLSFDEGAYDYTKLKVYADERGISLYEMAYTTVPKFAFINMQVGNDYGILFKSSSLGYANEIPYNTRIKVTGTASGVTTESASGVLRVRADLEVLSTVSASAKYAINAGDFIVENQGKSGYGIVRAVSASNENATILANGEINASSYLEVISLGTSTRSEALLANNMVFKGAPCLKPNGGSVCEAIYQYSAEISSQNVGLESMGGSVVIDEKARVSVKAKTGVKMNGGALNVRASSGLFVQVTDDTYGLGIEYSASSGGAASEVKGLLEVEGGITGIKNGTVSVYPQGGLHLNSPEAMRGTGSVVVAGGVIYFGGNVKTAMSEFASGNFNLVADSNSLLIIGGEVASLNSLFTYGKFKFVNTLMAVYDSDYSDGIYSLSTYSGCATACSMSSFGLKARLDALMSSGPGSSSSDYNGNKITWTSSCPSIFSATNCDPLLYDRLVSNYDTCGSKMYCYGAGKTIDGVPEWSGSTILLIYFGSL